MAHSQSYDVTIIGGGIAGLSVALRLPEHMRVALFTKGQLGESNTRYAQGGIAVALGDDDSPELHFRDTLAAGAGLCDEAAVRILVEEAPDAVRWLINDVGVQFDRAHPESGMHMTRDGLSLGREAAHCRWRVIHAGGDATGAEIERALMAKLLARASVDLYEETLVSQLRLQDGRCVGLQAVNHAGQLFDVESRATILASGGTGGLWLHTSNPSGATADGLALAWRAGAALTDLEFMQFHPTVLGIQGSSHLISEAVRGEGAYLRNHAGERFMPRYHEQAELAPRDVVARAMLSEMLAEQTDCQYLDLRHLPDESMYARFPTISAICREHGLDLAHDLLPIAPAAHYCMGGVMVDTCGRTSLPGLFAVGEVACTGVHGANRLASNSLLEGLVFGLRVADMLAGTKAEQSIDSARQALRVSLQNIPVQDALSPHTAISEEVVQRVQRDLRQAMWQYVSLCRDQAGLLEANATLTSLRRELLTVPGEQPATELATPHLIETLNMLLVAALVIAAALQRQESRGSHWRSDFERLDATLNARHYVWQSQAMHGAAPTSAALLQEVAPHA